MDDDLRGEPPPGPAPSADSLEAALRTRTAQLAQAENDLAAFSHSIAHELRTPLRGMKSFIEIVLDDFPASLEPEVKRYLEMALAGSRRMECLIEDLLFFSRINRLPLSPSEVDLDALVTEVWAELGDLQKNRSIDFRQTSLPPARADRTLLRHVWQALLHNALKFTRTRESAVIEVGARAEKSPVCYFVRDNGVGFDMKYSDKLFRLFERQHSQQAGAGSGVGLAAAHRIIRRHGGRIWPEARENGGATFFFTLEPGA
jgi:light-regulated signal transduction histidine kinase (bacteriophytochrome)